MTGSPCSPLLVPFHLLLSPFHLRLLPTFLHGAKGGGAASDCALVLVYDTAKRRMQHVFTVLFSVCPMPQLQPQLSSPNSRSPLYMLELSLKRLAILLDCAVVLKTRRIAPVCIGVASQTPPPYFPLPLAFCCPGQAEIYAHMLSTLFALKRGEGSKFAPF